MYFLFLSISLQHCAFNFLELGHFQITVEFCRLIRSRSLFYIQTILGMQISIHMWSAILAFMVPIVSFFSFISLLLNGLFGLVNTKVMFLHKVWFIFCWFNFSVFVCLWFHKDLLTQWCMILLLSAVGGTFQEVNTSKKRITPSTKWEQVKVKALFFDP